MNKPGQLNPVGLDGVAGGDRSEGDGLAGSSISVDFRFFPLVLEGGTSTGAIKYQVFNPDLLILATCIPAMPQENGRYLEMASIV